MAEDFVIRIAVQEEEVAKVFAKIQQDVQSLTTKVNKLKSGEKIFDRTASAATGLSKSLRQTRGSLDDLIRAQLKVKDAQSLYNKELQFAKSIASEFGRAVDFTNKKLVNAATNLQIAKSGLKQVSDEYNRASKSGRGFIDNLILQRKGFNDLSKRLDVAVRKIITYRLAFGVFREATEAFRDMFTQAIDMDDALGDLQKVLRGTTADLKRLRDSAFDFGIAFGRTPKDIVQGFKVFAQQGLNVQGIMDRTNALMLAVSATTLTNTQAIKALTVASKNFADEFDSLNLVVDKFLASERLVPVAAKDFADGLAQIGQIARELGLTLDELNGIIAAVGAVTQKTGKNIGTSFRTILSRSTSKDSIKAFQQLGILVLKTQNEFRPFGDILRDLSKEWGNMNQVQRINIATVLGQRRRYTDFLALMNNFDDFLKVTKASQEAFNDAQIAAQVETDKYKRRIQSLSTSFSDLKERVGEDLINTLFELGDGFGASLQNMAANAKSISTLIKLSSGLALSFVVLRIVTAAVGGIAFSMGINLLKIAETTTVVVTRTQALARAFAIFRIAAGPVLLLLGGLFAIYTILRAAADDTRRRQEEYNKSVLDAAIVAKNAQRENELMSKSIEEIGKATKKTTQIITEASAARIRAFQIEAAGFNSRIAILEGVLKRLQKIQAAGLPLVLRNKQGSIVESIVGKETGGQFQTLKDLEDAIGALAKARDQLFLQPGKVFAIRKDETEDIFNEQIGLFSKIQEKVIGIQFEIDKITTSLSRSRNAAILFRKPFNEVTAELKIYEEGFNKLNSQLSESEKHLKILLADQARGGKLVADSTGKLRTQNFSLDDQGKLIKEIAETEAAINVITAARNKLLSDNIDKWEKLAILRDRQRTEQSRLSVLTARENAETEKRIQLLKGISSALTGVSRSRLLNRNILRQQLIIESAILKSQSEKIQNDLRHKILAAQNTTAGRDEVKIEQLQNKLLNEQTNLRTKLNNLIVKSVENLVRENAAIQATVSSAISTGISGIPQGIAERKRAEEELAIRRKELEFELGQARIAEDQNAINQAIRGLQELELEARELGSVLEDIFLNVFGKIGEVQFQKLAETLTSGLMSMEFGNDFTIGQNIANEISQGTTTAAVRASNMIRDAIVQGGVITTKMLQSVYFAAGLTNSKNIELSHITGGNAAANAVKSGHITGGNQANLALRSAFAIGSQLLGQVLFGSGKGAAAGSGFGGILGGIIGGPIGRFVGSLAGGFIGSQFDDKPKFLEPLIDLKDTVDRNTIAIENNNKLLAIEREFINAPSRFIAPPAQGAFSGGINGGITVVNQFNGTAGAGISADDIANATAAGVNRALADGISQSRSRASAF